jgi:hypothetical protein
MSTFLPTELAEECQGVGAAAPAVESRIEIDLAGGQPAAGHRLV